ncbi:unnamed protein product [Bemisia tabaci]|uniref:Uncharacterized protein n=1 Tax=Bemisia tabaci TaxID=7038 RepID=A0A9P0ABU8_BEMTA|nr:unnamed protein product [Bemisia tabaci]
MAPAVNSNLLHNIVREANPVEAVCPNYLAHKRVIIPIKYLFQMEIPICAGFDWEERVHKKLLACAGGRCSARLKINPTSEPIPHPAPEPVATTSSQETLPKNQRECWICKMPAIRGTKRLPLCHPHYMKKINEEIKNRFCVLGEYAPQSVVGHFGQRLIGFREVTLCSYYKPGLDPDVDVPSGALVFLQVDLFSTIEVFGGSITLNGFCYHLHEGSWPDGCYSLYEYLRRPFVETERVDFSELPDEWYSEKMRFLRPG